MRHAAEVEIAAKVINALLAQRVDFGDALLRRADDGSIFRQIIVAEGELLPGTPPIGDALIDLAALADVVPPLHDVYYPIELVTGVFSGLFFGLRHVEIAEEGYL